MMIAACGESDLSRALDVDGPLAADAGSPDAGGYPDAAPRGAFERIDWRSTRGAALRTTTVSSPAGELFALAADGFVLRTGCDDPLGCRYTWYDGAGTVKKQREHLIASTATTVSPDGRLALLVAADEVGFCARGDTRFTVERGRLQLVDPATCETELELELRTNPWSATAFTRDSRWFFAAPIADGECLANRLGHRSVTPPFAEPPGLDRGAGLVQEIDAHRWLAFRGFELGVVDPDVAESFVSVGDGADAFAVAGGWVHTFVGPHDLAHEIVSLSPDDELRRTPVEQDEDWFRTQAQGRWVRVCTRTQLPGFRDCRILDVLGERSPLDVRVTHAPDHLDDAVLLGGGAFVFVGPSGEEQRAVQRLDLATGQLRTLHEGDGKLFTLGDGEAALLFQGAAEGDAWLIEAGREELIANRVRFMLTAPHVPALLERAVRQDDIALLAVSSGDSELGLLAFDLRTRRLAQLTDRLYLTPAFAVDGCGQPGTTRHAGGPLDALTQDSSHVFFVEPPVTDVDAATLWILPIDLSAPPRRLATLADPTLCHAPLTDTSGDRFGLREDDAAGDGVQITVATP